MPTTSTFLFVSKVLAAYMSIVAWSDEICLEVARIVEFGVGARGSSRFVLEEPANLG